MKRALAIILPVLIIDQAVKFWIKTHMYLGQEFQVFGDWFIIHFTENKGMAFGLELGGDWGKFLLSVFRIVVLGGIGWYLWRQVKSKGHPALITSLSLIFAGALGNIIDSAFYGMLFSESKPYLPAAAFLPEGGGYASFLHGKVVDMLYFPILEGTFPPWFPVWGGEEFIFFRPVFNIADSAITCGVAVFLLTQKKFMAEEKPSETSDTPQQPDAPGSSHPA